MFNPFRVCPAGFFRQNALYRDVKQTIIGDLSVLYHIIHRIVPETFPSSENP
jgi:hypothetical protein